MTIVCEDTFSGSSIFFMQKYFDIKVLYDKVKDIDLSGEYKGYKEYIDFFKREVELNVQAE